MLQIHDDATADLRAIAIADRAAFGKLVALIEQLRADPQLQARLLSHGYGAGGSAPIDVSKWLGVWRKVPLWRLKQRDLEQNGLRYRIIYVWDWRSQCYCMLAVVKRDDFDYDNPSDPIRQRVLRRCREEFPSL